MRADNAHHQMQVGTHEWFATLQPCSLTQPVQAICADAIKPNFTIMQLGFVHCGYSQDKTVVEFGRQLHINLLNRLDKWLATIQ